eukprot:CAMPEP_0177792002 /NCGR_PEP_ID=MMETSP0491_2-20121128/24270_1 /TAXON_ID=63592 /ORGANISM="Tetraselmis chuii, Strain PLY429" /LENGTH=372 /DNA_ID=CAMNT_0019314343 /DNA_START=152 /DNA_END=1270 /DNA_ORIENTATION=+
MGVQLIAKPPSTPSARVQGLFSSRPTEAYCFPAGSAHQRRKHPYRGRVRLRAFSPTGPSNSDSSSAEHNAEEGRRRADADDETCVSEEATTAVPELLSGLTGGDGSDHLHALHAVLHTLPVEAVDGWYTHLDRHGTQLCLHERLARLTVFLGHFLDACSMRVLLLNGTPREFGLLSSLSVEPGRKVQRARVVAASGEEVALSWHLELEQRSTGLTARWAVTHVQGEPADSHPAVASPTVSPEAVVMSQLAALAELDVQRCFAFTSPANREVIANDAGRFAEMLQSQEYGILLGHARSRVLLTRQVSRTEFTCLCEVEGTVEAPGGGDAPVLHDRCALFVWTVCLQQSGRIGDGSHNCWLTEDVYRSNGCCSW